MTGVASVDIGVGDRILMATGPAVVRAVVRHGIEVIDVAGAHQIVHWDQLTARAISTGSGVQAQHASLEPWWSGLGEAAQAEALLRLEVVLEVLTGFRHGCPQLAQPGEPFHPFGEGYGASVNRRIDAMALQLSGERQRDREITGRGLPEAIRGSTVR